jgi:hypothetical protein
MDGESGFRTTEVEAVQLLGFGKMTIAAIKGGARKGPVGIPQSPVLGDCCGLASKQKILMHLLLRSCPRFANGGYEVLHSLPPSNLGGMMQSIKRRCFSQLCDGISP